MPRVTRPLFFALATTLGLAGVSACGSNDTTSTSAASASSAASSAAATTATPSPARTPSQTPTQAPATSSPPAAPAPAPATSRTPQPTRTSPAAQAPAAAGLPTDAGDYGDELIGAWMSGDSGLVASHASAGAAATLKSAKRATGLIRTTCEEGVCSYSNEAGRRVTLTFDPARIKAGAAHAVTSAKVS